MKSKKHLFITGSLLLAVVFIVSVPVVDIVLSYFDGRSSDAADAGSYATRQIISGVVSETMRAVLTCYLYATTVGSGSSRGHAIRYGLLYSALIASLYIILGSFYFIVKDPLRFIIQDSLILIIQGVASGLVLYFVYGTNKRVRVIQRS